MTQDLDRSLKEFTRALLQEGAVTLYFTKANGEYREMRASLNPSYIEAVLTQDPVEPDPDRAYEVVWDIEAGQWKSFRYDRLVDFSV